MPPAAVSWDQVPPQVTISCVVQPCRHTGILSQNLTGSGQ